MKTIKEIYAYREMIISLVRKDLRGRYKGSVLGFLWTFVNPLLQLIVYTLVFSVILKNNIEKYYLFLFVALVPWIFFSSSLTVGASCILSEKEMIKKIYFPREVLPISYITSSFFNMLFSFIVIFVVLIFSGVYPKFSVLAYLPFVILIEYLLCLGISLLTSSVTVYFRDLEHILSIVSMAWMYLTPIMYHPDLVPAQYLTVYKMNPMYSIVVAYRDILYYGIPPQLDTLVRGLVLGCLVLVIGMFTFSRLKRHFVEEL